MKKIFIILILVINSFTLVSANYNTSFMNSPNKSDLVIIQDDHIRYCEEIYLRFSRRGGFTEEQNETCRNIFARKIEAQIEYNISKDKERGIY